MKRVIIAFLSVVFVLQFSFTAFAWSDVGTTAELNLAGYSTARMQFKDEFGYVRFPDSGVFFITADLKKALSNTEGDVESLKRKIVDSIIQNIAKTAIQKERTEKQYGENSYDTFTYETNYDQNIDINFMEKGGILYCIGFPLSKHAEPRYQAAYERALEIFSAGSWYSFWPSSLLKRDMGFPINYPFDYVMVTILAFIILLFFLYAVPAYQYRKHGQFMNAKKMKKLYFIYGVILYLAACFILRNLSLMAALLISLAAYSTYRYNPKRKHSVVDVQRELTDEEVSLRPLSNGKAQCPYCKSTIEAKSEFCPICGRNF